MRITRIDIDNYKAIEHLSLDLTEGFNVFVGNNGDGKSSVLQAINILLSWLAARIKNPKGNGLRIEQKDIRHGADACLLQMTVEHCGTKVFWKLYQQSERVRRKTEIKTNLVQLNAFANRLVNDSREEHIDWPVFTYYGVNRSVIDVPHKRMPSAGMEYLSLYDKQEKGSGVDLKSFFNWFRNTQDEENYALRYEGSDHLNPHLQAIRKTTETILPGYSKLKVRLRPLRFEMEKNGEPFPFEQFSDGEKCYLALVMDMARRLSVANADLQTEQARGVFLVDEIDLHLHLSWQIDVVDRLKAAFPNCQFIVTTHSPMILTNIGQGAEDSLYIMEGGTCRKRMSSSYGLTLEDNALANLNVPGVRNKAVQKMIDDAFEELVLNHPDMEKVSQQIASLQEIIPSDPILARIKLEKTKKMLHA